MYEVWSAVGSRLEPGPRFRALADAIRYVDTRHGGASLGIRNPDGSWHVHPLTGPTAAEADTSRPPTPAPWRARILVVDDDPGSREALAELLSDEGYNVDTAGDGDAALSRVAQDPPDLIISDVRMPHVDGLDLVVQLRQRAALSDLPIILVSGVDDPTGRIGGLDLGADDYLPKPLDGEELLARIRLHLRHAERSREIVARSATDELTGVLNRGGIIGVLERERERARRDGTPLAVLVLDIDDFKSINDTLGHSAGDEVLARLADKLVRAVRTTDRVGRFGGDEFLIVAPNTGPAAIEVLTRRIKAAQRTLIQLGDGSQLSLHLSIGSAIDGGALTMEELFNHADAAMYREKRLRSQMRGRAQP